MKSLSIKESLALIPLSIKESLQGKKYYAQFDKRYFVGISLGFNSSAACVDEKGNLVKAISEERLIREKNTKKIPYRSLQFVVSGCVYVSKILYYSYYDVLDKAYFDKYEPDYIYSNDKTPEENLLQFIYYKTDFKFEKAIRVDHHLAHAYSVFPYYKVPKNSIIITSDGYGDSLSFTVRTVKDINSLIYIKTLKDSVALVYQFITGALGLKMHQHEGKVTGLAAYGDICEAQNLLIAFYKRFSNYCDSWSYKGENFAQLKHDVFAFCKEYLSLAPEEVNIDVNDIKITSLCLMAQMFIEDETLKRTESIPKQNKYHLFLAGGLFANVKLNTQIVEYCNFKSVNVAPPMGDEGTAIGAVLSRFNPLKLPKGKFENVYSGVSLEYKPNAFNVLWEKDIHYSTYDNENQLIKEIAKILADGGIVHYRNGDSEFGPRALCHSSTFYQATDPEGTKLLNRTLGRSEYMPYAPIILAEDVRKIFMDYDGKVIKKLKYSNQYMTAILDVIGSWNVRSTYSGAIHIDGTARPQILYDKKSFAYRLLKEYKKQTGLLMLINTSWNIHGNPTVATVADSKLTWRESNYCGDALVHGNTMYRRIVNDNQ